MTDALRAAVLSALAEIAPEADLSRVRSDVPLREQLDLDSMDMLNFMVGCTRRWASTSPQRTTESSRRWMRASRT